MFWKKKKPPIHIEEEVKVLTAKGAEEIALQKQNKWTEFLKKEEEKRELRKKENLEEDFNNVVKHINRRASDGDTWCYYDLTRMSPEVKKKLKKLGYKIYEDEVYSYYNKIMWYE